MKSSRGRKVDVHAHQTYEGDKTEKSPTYQTARLSPTHQNFSSSYISATEENNNWQKGVTNPHTLKSPHSSSNSFKVGGISSNPSTYSYDAFTREKLQRWKERKKREMNAKQHEQDDKKQRENLDDCGMDIITSPLTFLQNLFKGDCMGGYSTGSASTFDDDDENDFTEAKMKKNMRRSRQRGRERRGSDDDTVYTNSEMSNRRDSSRSLSRGIDSSRDGLAYITIPHERIGSKKQGDLMTYSNRSIPVTQSIPSGESLHYGEREFETTSLKEASGSKSLSPIRSQPSNQDSASTDDVIQRNESEMSANSASFLEQISSEGIILSWHKIAKTTSELEQPMLVRIFIEISESDKAFTSPHEPYLILEVIRVNGAITSPFKREKFRLFDIDSITNGDAMIVENYPFAIPRHSFSLTLLNGSILLLEATHEQQAKYIVCGLRWMLARLAFNIVIGNPEACEELLPLQRIKHKHNKTRKVDDTELIFIMQEVTHHLVDIYATNPQDSV